MTSDDFINWFGETIENNNSHWSDEDELDQLWREYNDLVNDLKADGYKIYRNKDGRHRIEEES